MTRSVWSNGQPRVTSFGTATVKIPAALAASAPTGESSNTTASGAEMPRSSSAAR